MSRVLLDCFPLFLYFLTSQFKLTLWLIFFSQTKKGKGHGGGRGRIIESCCFIITPVHILSSINLYCLATLTFRCDWFYFLTVVVVFSHSVMFNFLGPHGLQHTRPLCLSPHPEVPKFMFIASVMPSSHLILWCPLLLLPSIFPSVKDFTVSRLFASDDQNTGASASASVLPTFRTGFPLRLTGLNQLYAYLHPLPIEPPKIFS